MELQPDVPQITEQLGMMTDALKGLKSKATELLEEQVRKKARTDVINVEQLPAAEGLPGTSAAASFPSQAPFGKAGS